MAKTAKAVASNSNGLAPRRELFAWAMYDFANSGYTTVVLTAIFNTYFVGVVAASGDSGNGESTLLWSITVSIAYALVLVSAPVLGAIADYRADKKRFLAVTTIGCIVFTAMLAWVGPGDVLLAMVLVVLATFMFAMGEGLISSFLPEIAPQQHMGRLSGYAWALGYIGGLLILGVCLIYITWAQNQGQTAQNVVQIPLLITAAAFALGALPTFVWLRERAHATPLPPGQGYIAIGFHRLGQTLRHARHFRDLFRFLGAMAVFYCGIYTVIVLAAVYAQEVMGFTSRENITMILIVNITAAVGAFVFGQVQDRLGSVRTLILTMMIWIVALVLVFYIESRAGFWLAANLIGLALGSSQSAGRALVGQFAPAVRAAEFFGLWSLAGKLAAVIGPLSYGVVTYVTHGNHRMAMLTTAGFFMVGLLLLFSVNEARGRRAAHEAFIDR